jgi:hypothetical protein
MAEAATVARPSGATRWRTPLIAASERLPYGLQRRVFDTDVRDLVRMVRSYRRNGPRVMCWHDSVWISIAREDEDRRPVAPLLREEIGDFFYLGRGGYHAGVFRSLARTLSRLGSLPELVVFPLTLPRGTSVQWRMRPDLRFEETIRRLDAYAAQPRPFAWVQAPPPFPPPEAWAAYEALPVESRFSTHETVAQFEAAKREPVTSDDERRRRAAELFAFHFGHTTTADNERYVELVDAIRLIRAAGVRAVVYVTPLNVAGGVELLGPGFADHIASELTTVRDLVAPMGAEFFDFSAEFGPEQFFHRWHSAEHLRADGRRRLAQLIAETLR